MSEDNKKKMSLSKKIRSIRKYLFEHLHESLINEYNLVKSIEDTFLSEVCKLKRAKIEEWISNQILNETKEKKQTTEFLRNKFIKQISEQASYRLVNKHIFLRLLEGFSLHKEVLKGGFDSYMYNDFKDKNPDLCKNEATGYSLLLEEVYSKLSNDVPGVFGDSEIIDLVSVPEDCLIYLVNELDDNELVSYWKDDLTFGWVYQYWNDPEMKVVNDKVKDGGKVENHEIAAKTRVFTEKYMVDWLLQNSLGPKWIAICKKNEWIPEIESKGILSNLEIKRQEWRNKREKEEISLTELMPIEGKQEEDWSYYVSQEISSEDIEHAPNSIRDIKIFEPSCGTGHFLVIAMDLLFALYKEESRHLGEENMEAWSDKEIVESILENNLFGLDIDKRAVKIATSTLWLKAKSMCQNSNPNKINVLDCNLKLKETPENEEALSEFYKEIEDEIGLPPEVMDSIFESLEDVCHLGSLLKINQAIKESLKQYEKKLGIGNYINNGSVLLDIDKTIDLIIKKLDSFISRFDNE